MHLSGLRHVHVHMQRLFENLTMQQRLIVTLILLWLRSALQAQALVVSVLFQQRRCSYGSSEGVGSSLFGSLPAGPSGLSGLPAVLSPRWSKADKPMHVTQVPNIQE